MTNPGSGPLAGIRVVDLTRLAPGPYGSMLLADLGADVIVVGGGRAGLPVPALSRGKRFITLDLKSATGREALRQLVADADVLVEGFRPGVAERLGAGWRELAAVHPRLVYCSLTGYGQTGELAGRAGHDINYLAMAGALGMFGPPDGPPVPPSNLLADFAAGGLHAAFAVVTALYERERSGRGQYLDVAMVDGVRSMLAMPLADWGTRTFPGRGRGLLAGSTPFYRCYECADGRYVAVGALERLFFTNLWRQLDLGPVPDHLDPGTWPRIELLLGEAFGRKPCADWAMVFAEVDACVTPVLAPHEVAPPSSCAEYGGHGEAASVPAVPVLSRTPADPGVLDTTDVTEDVLAGLGMSGEDVREARGGETAVTGLSWPPL